MLSFGYGAAAFPSPTGVRTSAHSCGRRLEPQPGRHSGQVRRKAGSSSRAPRCQAPPPARSPTGTAPLLRMPRSHQIRRSFPSPVGKSLRGAALIVECCGADLPAPACYGPQRSLSCANSCPTVLRASCTSARCPFLRLIQHLRPQTLRHPRRSRNNRASRRVATPSSFPEWITGDRDPSCFSACLADSRFGS